MLNMLLFVMFLFLAVMSIFPWLMLILGKFSTGLTVKDMGIFLTFEMMNGMYLPIWILGLTLVIEFISLTYLISLTFAMITGSVLGILLYRFYKSATRIPM